METLVHTASGKLKVKVQGPVLSQSCRNCKPDLTRDPVPCTIRESQGDPCQCRNCLEHYDL